MRPLAHALQMSARVDAHEHRCFDILPVIYVGFWSHLEHPSGSNLRME
jgi:hypothetical protein